MADERILLVDDDPEFEVAGLELGAVDFISKPVSAPLVLARVRTQLRLKQMADALRCLSMIDGLTGVANRRAFDENFDAEWRRSLRAAKPLAWLMVDADQLKAYNHRHGHPAGDTCLKRVAAAGERDAAPGRQGRALRRGGDQRSPCGIDGRAACHGQHRCVERPNAPCAPPKSPAAPAHMRCRSTRYAKAGAAALEGISSR